MAVYDETWKEAMNQCFEPFVAFFFPHVHRDIEWSRGWESLDNPKSSVSSSDNSIVSRHLSVRSSKSPLLPNATIVTVSHADSRRTSDFAHSKSEIVLLFATSFC